MCTEDKERRLEDTKLVRVDGAKNSRLKTTNIEAGCR